MSALSPKADIAERDRHVRFVPKADIVAYSINSSARASSDDGNVKPSALAVLRLTISSYFVGAWTVDRFLAFEDTIDVRSGSPKLIVQFNSIGDKPTPLRMAAEWLKSSMSSQRRHIIGFPPSTISSEL